MVAVMLGVVGLCEALWGAYVMFFPSKVLTLTIGPLLSVDAQASSPALVPSIAQTGALRLAIGLMVLAVISDPAGHKVANTLGAAVVFHACVLQPFFATCRAHARQPIRSALLVALVEGACVLCGMAIEDDFDLLALSAQPAVLVTVGAFAVGIAFAVASFLKKTCCAKVSDGYGLSPLAAPTAAQPLILDDNKFKLSPGARRLLS